MRHNKLDLNLLTALKALLKEKNVTRAGESLHLTQSAMSGILGRLRDYFDDPLIVQVGRKMELTPLAESLVAPISDLLLRIDTTITSRPEFDPLTTRRHFSIVASDYSIRVLLLKVLREVYQLAPGITIDFVPPSERSAAELEAGEVDFIIQPDLFMSRSQTGLRLFEDNYCLLVDAQNDEVGETISLDQYLGLGHVAYQTSKIDLPFFENWFDREYGDLRRVEVAVHSFDLLPQLLIGTRRIATMHSRVLSTLPSLPVRRVQPLFALPRLVEMLQWHHYREQDMGSRWLREHIITMAQKLPTLT
jgi:LysR family transcriptional regulator, nod-box dependent transcriptional activator